MSACRRCGCTDDDCRQCIEKTGEACWWIEPDLCSACAPAEALRATLDELVARGDISRQDADEAFTMMDSLSDAELRGEVSTREALQQVGTLAFGQLRRRSAS